MTAGNVNERYLQRDLPAYIDQCGTGIARAAITHGGEACPRRRTPSRRSTCCRITRPARPRGAKVYSLLGGAAAAGAVIVLIGGFYIDSQIEAVTARNAVLQHEPTRRWTARSARFNTLKKDIEALLDRQRAIEGLQAGRNLPVQLTPRNWYARCRKAST